MRARWPARLPGSACASALGQPQPCSPAGSAACPVPASRSSGYTPLRPGWLTPAAHDSPAPARAPQSRRHHPVLASAAPSAASTSPCARVPSSPSAASYASLPGSDLSVPMYAMAGPSPPCWPSCCPAPPLLPRRTVSPCAENQQYTRLLPLAHPGSYSADTWDEHARPSITCAFVHSSHACTCTHMGQVLCLRE